MFVALLNAVMIAHAFVAVVSIRASGIPYHPIRPAIAGFAIIMAAGAAGLLLRPIL